MRFSFLSSYITVSLTVFFFTLSSSILFSIYMVKIGDLYLSICDRKNLCAKDITTCSVQAIVEYLGQVKFIYLPDWSISWIPTFRNHSSYSHRAKNVTTKN